MEFRLFTCRHCGYEAYYVEAMLKHIAESHKKPELTSQREVYAVKFGSSPRTWGTHPTTRGICREILRRLPLMSYSAASMAIDSAMETPNV
jgi:hypothetical protein